MDAIEEIEKYAHLLAITKSYQERSKQRNKLIELLATLRRREQALRLKEDLFVRNLMQPLVQ